MNVNVDKQGLLEERILNELDYNPSTGIVSRKSTGKEAGDENNGYRRIGFAKKGEYNLKMSTHRIAWFLHYGVWPAEDMDVDHVDRNRSNNKIVNLRLIPHRLNSLNNDAKHIRKVASGNYQVRIGDGGNLFNKTYKTLAEAEAAKEAATIAVINFYLTERSNGN